MEAIGVTHFDLLREFSASDDEQRKAQDRILAGILAATDGNLSYLNRVHEYIEALKSDDALPGILEDRRRQRQRVHKNQRLGEQVENLVRQNLEDEGFTVKRVPIGSDFEIQHDLVEKDRFLLCVVPVEDENTELDLDEVRVVMRFVTNIGSRVDKLCEDFAALEGLRSDITADESDGLQLEVIPGAVRVRVASSVWNTGVCLEDLPQLLSGQD